MTLQTELLNEAFNYARTLERIRAAVHAADSASRAVQSVRELKPDLSPELDAATTGLVGSSEALLRAFDTATAMFDSELDKIGKRLEEGGQQ